MIKMWQMAKSNDKKASQNFEGGLNQGAPPFDIKDDETVEEYGWDTDKFPALHTHKKPTAYGAIGASQINLLANYQHTHMVRSAGTALQWDNAGTWTAITGTFSNIDWDSTNFNGKLILTNGTDNVKQWNGSALSDLTGAPKGKYITSNTVRVWIAQANTISFCAFQNELDWTSPSDSGIDQFYTPNGGDITALTTFQDNVTVFKKDAMGIYLGKNFFTQQLQTVSNDIGCISYKTVQEVGDTLFWLGQSDVYGFKGGKPYPIGQPIRQYLDDINQTYVSKCFGGTDGIRYYLGLVTGANTEPNVLLIYDQRINVWRVASLSDGFRYATFFNNVMYIGDYTGQTYKMKQTFTGSTFQTISKPFNEDIPETEKEYYEMHIQAYIPTGSALSVYVSTRDRDLGDGFDWTLIDTLTSSTLAQNGNIIVPLDTVPLTNWFRYKLEGTGEVEIYGVQRYFRLQPTQH